MDYVSTWDILSRRQTLTQDVMKCIEHVKKIQSFSSLFFEILNPCDLVIRISSKLVDNDNIGLLYHYLLKEKKAERVNESPLRQNFPIQALKY